jgi:hypothetical protein
VYVGLSNAASTCGDAEDNRRSALINQYRLPKTLGTDKIASDAAYAPYAIRLYENGTGQPLGVGQLEEYSRFAGSVWDLVMRGIAVVLAGNEELPPRPIHPWRREP